MNLKEKGASKTYIFNYQSAEGVCNKYDWSVALHECEL